MAVLKPLLKRQMITPFNSAYIRDILFGNGEQGAMYIPQPTVLGQQVLYQDAAGTVPVTADGDPVGYMVDLSGNGSHATQSTSAIRPIYRTDGTLHWLEPDGVGDRMGTPLDLSLMSEGYLVGLALGDPGNGRLIDSTRLIYFASGRLIDQWSDPYFDTSGLGLSWSGNEAFTLRNDGVTTTLNKTDEGQYQISAAPSSGLSGGIHLFARPDGAGAWGGRFYGAAILAGVAPESNADQLLSYLARINAS